MHGTVLRQVEEAAEGAGSEGVRAERIRIKDVKPGDRILSHDNRRDKTRFARVVFVFEHETARQTSLVTARTSEGQALKLQVSRKHVLPVLASSGNMTQPDVKHVFADELKEGDVVCISPVASETERSQLRVDLMTPLQACQHTAKIVTVQNRTQRVMGRREGKQERRVKLGAGEVRGSRLGLPLRRRGLRDDLQASLAAPWRPDI